jgi:phospholipase C
VVEPNITPWRRAVTGDLTSAFDFATPDDKPVMVPAVTGLIDRMMASAKLAEPAVPDQQSLPRQEHGQRPARALPYRLAMTDKVGQAIDLSFENSGTAGAVFHVVSAGVMQPGPWTFTVEAGKSLAGSVPLAKSYDLSVHGPNGFFRQLKGAGLSPLRVEARTDDKGAVLLTIFNDGDKPADVSIADGYRVGADLPLTVPAKGSVQDKRPGASLGHWYDLTVTSASQPGWLRRLAGHVETGKPSVTDPMLA